MLRADSCDVLRPIDAAAADPWEPLDAILERVMSTQDPLAAFSFYLSGRHRVLLTIADEIVSNLDMCDRSDESPPRARASDLMWLRTLGAYEVTRTLCQARSMTTRAKPAFCSLFFR